MRLTFRGNQNTSSCSEVEPVNRFEPNLRIPGPTSLQELVFWLPRNVSRVFLHLVVWYI